MSANVIQDLYYMSLDTPLIFLEDVTTTGILREKVSFFVALVSLTLFKKDQYFARKVYSIFWSKSFSSIDKFNLLNHSKSENWWFRWRSDFVVVIEL